MAPTRAQVTARRRARRRLRPLACAAAALLGSVVTVLAPAGGASASQVPATLPTANPANFTPNVENGEVDTIWQVGTRVVIGGTFTSVSNATQNGGAVYTRNRLATFNATTGVIDTGFAPNINGNVNVVIPSADPNSVYVAGSFTSVNGTTRSRIARVNLADGSLVTAFNAGTIGAQIRDIRLANGVLYIAGDFSTVAGQARSRLAALDPTTGALQATPNLAFAGTHNGGTTNIIKMDITPNGSRLLAIGNFTTVNGQDRRQIALVDLAANPDALSNWQTNFFNSTCASAFNTFMRDLDIAPDGTFAVVTTTGAYRPPPSSCDTNSRFELTNESGGLQPTWVNYTGGDTSYAVEIQNGVAFVGGHMRWANNPFAGDSAGAGAIPREGIQALDVTNGLPFSWNPGRARGVGVFDFHVTAQGLWAGSDTNTWAGEQRRRLAFFPFAGGINVSADDVGELPNDVFTLGRVSGGGLDDVQRRFYSGTGAPGATTVFPGTTDWRNARGAFMVGPTLFSFHSNGTVQRRSFNGTTFGAATTTEQYLNNMSADLPNVTGLAYDTAAGRIYYTIAGQNALYYRGFTPESTAVGALRANVTGSVAGLQPTRVQGMFLANGNLYFADANSGNLLRISFANGVLGGSATVVDTTVDWRGRALFAWNGTPAGGGGGNTPPNASFTSNCTGLTCTFNAAGSTDDGSIVSYQWNFGDGGNGTGVNASRTYAAGGTYNVTLTVVDDDGASDTANASVTVSAGNQAPNAAFTSNCGGLSCAFNAGGSTDDGGIVSYLWNFGDGGNGTGVNPSRTYAAGGTYTVTLTVADAQGLTDTATAQVTVQQPTGTLALRATASSNANATAGRVTVPAAVQAGDQLVMVVSTNRAATMTTPAGWTLLGQATDGTPDLASNVYTRTADGATAGSTVTVALDAQSKTSVVLLAYGGAAAITTVAGLAEPGNTANHASPPVNVSTAGSIVASYWVDKTAGNTGWTTAGNVVERVESLGTGAGQVTAVAGDSGPLPAGTWAGSTAISSVASAKAIMWSVVIAPA